METLPLVGLINNIALLVALGVLYETVSQNWRLDTLRVRILSGLILGSIGVAVMMNPWRFGPGIIFDARSILLSVGGLFFGWLPALMAVIITSAYRFIQGGAGAWTGVAVIVTSGVIGVVWGKLRNDSIEKITSKELLLLGIAVHTAMLLWMLSLPWPLSLEVLKKISLPVMLLYPVGTILWGKLLAGRILRTKSEEEIEKSEQRLQTVLQKMPVMMNAFDENGNILIWNRECEKVTGFSAKEIAGNPDAMSLLYPDQSYRLKMMAEWKDRGNDYYDWEWDLSTKDGEKRTVSWSNISDRFPIAGWASWGFGIDITDHKQLEKQLVESQKMEAVGTLAGGIAHDFNNLLQIISGHAELLEMELMQKGMRYEEMDAIRHSAHKAADLVKQILTFSRRLEGKFEHININKEIEMIERLLYRTIPKMIDIELSLERSLKSIRADSSQMEQMLINLAVNAKDAMPEGGKLIIETDNVNLDEQYCLTHAECKPGEYVRLRVEDSGHGMEPSVMERIFDPFYTTKEVGEGTGLGLSTVFGIVKMHDGHITCESEVGKGTTFEIYFPAAESAKPEFEKEQDSPIVAGGSETILVVDDEPLIRELAKRILEKAGYSVMTAGSGKEAVETYFQDQSAIALVILDLIMPEMGGKQCLEELLKINPQVKALIASGFAIKGETKTFLDTEAKGNVTKPFNMRDLLRSVRHVLDGA